MQCLQQRVHTLQLKKNCLQQAILQRDEQIMQLKDVTGNVCMVRLWSFLLTAVRLCEQLAFKGQLLLFVSSSKGSMLCREI